MLHQDTVVPSATLSELYPAGTVFAARSSLELTRWVHNDKFRLDTASGFPMSILGEMPLICHQQVNTADIRAFFLLAGIRLTAPFISYKTADEAMDAARHFLSRGYRLAYYYPPLPGIDSDNILVVPIDLYNRLNDKANLDSLCDKHYLPPCHLYPPGNFDKAVAEMPDQAVYFKACFAGASGAGTDVRYCPDMASRKEVIEWFSERTSGLTALRMETDVNVQPCWCLNLAITETGVRYLGAATQLFSSPGLQYGNRIDPDELPDDEIISIALAIGETARQQGYLGIAGFDIGTDANDRPYVFDLNFRMTACTTQILMHDAATRRINSRISQSLALKIRGPLAPALERLAGFVERGNLVPLRLYERTRAPGDQSLVNAMLIGCEQEEIDNLEAEIHAVLPDLLPD